jgi:hypothetical protein
MADDFRVYMLCTALSLQEHEVNAAKEDEIKLRYV